MSQLGEMTHVTLRVPALADVLDELCGGTLRPPQTAPLLGRVTDASGRPQVDILIKLAWEETDSYRPQLLAVPRGPAGETPREWTLGSEGSRATVETKTDARRYLPAL